MSKRKYTKKEKQVTLQTPVVDTNEMFVVDNTVPAQEQPEVFTSTAPAFTFHSVIENEGESNGVVTDELINGLDPRCYPPKTPRGLINPNNNEFEGKPLCGMSEHKPSSVDDYSKKVRLSLKGSIPNKTVPVENTDQVLTNSVKAEYNNPADFYVCTSNPNEPCIHHEIKAQCDELKKTIEDKDKELEALRSKIEVSTKMIESLFTNIDNKTINTVPASKFSWVPNFIKNLFK